MSSPQNVVEGLMATLGGGLLTTTLSGRIYQGTAKHNDTLPHMVFRVDDNPEVARHFGGKIRYTFLITFEIWGRKDTGTTAATGVGTLEEELFADLDEVALAVTGLDRGLVLFVSRGVREVVEDAILSTSEAVVIGTTTP